MYRFLPLRVVEEFEPLAKARGVSVVARSRQGFLGAYRRAGGRKSSLGDHWTAKRDGFIARHMAQAKAGHEPLFEPDGTPTRRHLALIMWAFSPCPSLLSVRYEIGDLLDRE